ncbi:MAG TPA: hypothetical protein VII41_05385, partial [Steroidobacteraceae bacterium]
MLATALFTALLAGAHAVAADGAATALVAPDLAEQLAKFKRVRMPFDATALNARERKMIGKLVEACRYLDRLYWQQSDPDGRLLYQQLQGQQAADARNLRRFLRINGSRYDLIRNNEPFVGSAAAPAGANLYPPDLTREEFERYVAAHPARRAALYDPLALVVRHGADLEATPYHVAYHQWLEPMATLLRDAADLSDDPAFANFLRLRADALLNDDYSASDLAWLDLDNPKIDLIFAPYESYLDALLGVKTSYGAAVLVRNDVESRKLDVYLQYVPQIQDALPLAA